LAEVLRRGHGRRRHSGDLLVEAPPLEGSLSSPRSFQPAHSSGEALERRRHRRLLTGGEVGLQSTLVDSVYAEVAVDLARDPLVSELG
jgi:hypothetical protein